MVTDPQPGRVELEAPIELVDCSEPQPANGEQVPLAAEGLVDRIFNWIRNATSVWNKRSRRPPREVIGDW